VKKNNATLFSASCIALHITHSVWPCFNDRQTISKHYCPKQFATAAAFGTI